MSREAAPVRKRHTTSLVVFVACGLVVLTLAPYWRVCTFGFVDLDDSLYVFANPFLGQGLSRAGIAWAFTTFYGAFWHPLTWLSLLLDYQVFGLRPWGYHLTNLLLHLANTLLLFHVLRRLTGLREAGERTRGLWPCAFVAALFAIHPLHVESVAWVAERKDVLSTFFWFLAMLAYVRYVERPRLGRYLVVAMCLALGLMAKTMLVTLPCVFLLLDYWPLGRLESKDSAQRGLGRRCIRLVIEKLPLFGVAAAFCALSILAQRQELALTSFEGLPLRVRLSNALVSYVGYIAKTGWPTRLAAFYPHPRDTLAFWQVAGAALVLSAITAVALIQARRRPYLAVGWLWYIGTLVPVIQLVQVGTHAMADRYTYVPLIGLFIIVAWGLPDLLPRNRDARPFLVVASCAALATLTIVAAFQVVHWRNTETLFRHAVAVTSNNALAHNGLGREFLAQGRYAEAETEFREAARIQPENVDPYLNLGKALARKGGDTEAAEVLRMAIGIEPGNADAHDTLGFVLLEQGDSPGAERECAEAVRLRPDLTDARNNLAAALLAQHKWAQAGQQLETLLAATPNDPDVHTNLGIALAEQGKTDQALAQFSEALRLDPNHPNAKANLERYRRIRP